MAAIPTKPVKGTRDWYPTELRVRAWLFDHWRAVSRSFGYEEYDACVLEHEQLYVRKAGDEIVDQLYGFEDKGGRRVALRPEMTPSLVRMLLARGGTVPLPARWFAIPQCFRYERMQRGRKREHYQWNCDLVGLDTPAAEVELMAAQVAFLERIGLAADVAFKLSDRRLLQHHLAGLGIEDETFAAVCVVVDKHDKIGRAACAEELDALGIAAAARDAVLDLVELRGLAAIEEKVGTDNPGVRRLRELLAIAEAAGIADHLTVDCSVVRGLSYYTGAVWELYAGSGELTRAIAGGGRYDDLMAHLGGRPTPMVGFGMGDVVLMELLAERGLLPEAGSDVEEVVYPMEADGFAAATRLATRLRADGKRVVVDYSARRFKHVVRAAEEAGAARLWIIGEAELADGKVKVRDLATREERERPLDA